MTMLLGMAIKLKKNNVLTPAFQWGILLSTGRGAQLVGEVEFEAATAAATFSAVAVVAALGCLYTHSRWC